MKRHEWNRRIILIVILLTITGCVTAVWGQATVPYTLYRWYEEQLESAANEWEEIVEIEKTKYQLELITQIREEIEDSIVEIEAYIEENHRILQEELERKKEEQLSLYKEQQGEVQEAIKDHIQTTTASALCIATGTIKERESLYVEE